MSPAIGFARGLAEHPELAALGVDFQYAWLEGCLEASLAFLPDVPDWRDLTRWPAGRLFGDPGEYRWQMNAQGLHAVIILEDGIPLPSPFDNGSPLPLAPGDDSLLILYGEWVDPHKDLQANPDGGPWFYAREIPRPQYYPFDATIDEIRWNQEEEPSRRRIPRLMVRRYRHSSESGHPNKGEFIRCVRLSAASETDDTGRPGK